MPQFDKSRLPSCHVTLGPEKAPTEAVMDNPLGGIKRGWSEICQTYQRLFSTPATYAFEF
jgi:hypothetical protein